MTDSIRRILTVVYSLEKGGTQRAAQNFAEGYQANGLDSRVLYTREDGLRRGELEAAGVPVYCLLDSADRIALLQWQPQLVHLHSHLLTLAEFDLIKSSFPAARMVETNVFSIPSPWAGRLELSFQLAQWCLWRYIRRAGAACPVSVVPYPVKIAAFTRSAEHARRDFRAAQGLQPDDILLGRIGQSFDGKWSPLLIDTFNRLRRQHPRLRLLVVNPPPIILRGIARSRWREDIVVIDRIEGDGALCDCYSAIDIFVAISDLGESFGMVLAEAQLCETPVVAFATPWQDNSQIEVVADGIGGAVVATRRALEAALQELIDDPGLRQKLGRQGRAHIAAAYDHRSVARLALAATTPPLEAPATPEPLQMMNRVRGSLGPVSRWLLRRQRGLAWLRYTTGYEPWRRLPVRLLRKFYRRLRADDGSSH